MLHCNSLKNGSEDFVYNCHICITIDPKKIRVSDIKKSKKLKLRWIKNSNKSYRV